MGQLLALITFHHFYLNIFISYFSNNIPETVRPHDVFLVNTNELENSSQRKDFAESLLIIHILGTFVERLNDY